MPNHITNELTVIGNIDDMKTFKEMFLVKEGRKVSGATFDRIHPMPVEYKDNEGWYEWRISNWGTKWDAYEFRVFESVKNKLECEFWTAWSPPAGFILKASQEFPNLVFDMYYMDEGANFCGMIHAENGWINDECVDVEYEVDERAVYYEQDGDDYVWKYKDDNSIVDKDTFPDYVNPLKNK